MRKNGFTLIELLVSISIVGLLFTVGIAYYQDFNRQQLIVQTTKEFKNNLRHAQSKALAGEKNESVCGVGLAATPLEGWFIDIAADSYEIYGRCGGSKFGTKTVQLPPTVTLSASANTFYFQPLSRGVSQDLINFCISGYNRYYRMSITKSGEIKDEGFASSCS